MRFRPLLPILYMAGLFSLSSIHGDVSTTPAESLLAWLSPNAQNLLHVPVWAGLAGLWLWALKGRKQAATLAAAFSIGYGVIDELYQGTVPGRYCSLSDLLFDGIGVTVALLLFIYLAKSPSEK